MPLDQLKEPKLIYVCKKICGAGKKEMEGRGGEAEKQEAEERTRPEM